MTDLERLAERLLALQPDDESVLDKLRLHVADTYGAWIAACAMPEGRALIAYRRRLAAITQVADPLDEVALHCALARASEVDDIHLASMITAGSIVIPAAVTLARLEGCDRHEIAAAMLSGYEAMIRLGRAIDGPKILYRGIWPTYFAAPFGVAAVASRLLKLSRDQMAHALALALTMAAPSVGQHHAPTTARWWLIGQAARAGASAVLAVHAGFTADLAMMGPRWLPGVFGIEPDLSAFAPGKQEDLAFNEVSFKPWCAARQTMAATQALREAISGGVAPQSIRAVKAFVLPPHLKMVTHGVHPGDRASYLTSLPYQMALAALAPKYQFRLGPTDEEGNQVEPGLADFMARVSVESDEGLLGAYPKKWPARIVVETNEGSIEHRVNAVPGDPGRPLTGDELSGKFEAITANALSRSEQQRRWRLGLELFQVEGTTDRGRFSALFSL
jgi:2-methylcitrate dehydratase PrpD